MRILTVRQPWAWAIIHGGKDVENRVRNIAGDYRGPIAIHVGLQHDHDHDRQMIGAAVGEWSRANPGVSSADNPDPRKSRPFWYGNLGQPDQRRTATTGAMATARDGLDPAPRSERAAQLWQQDLSRVPATV